MALSCFRMALFAELMNRLSSDTTMIQNACTSNTSMMRRFGLQVILSTVLLFYTSWKLTLIMFAVVPALVVITRVYSTLTRKLSKRYQDVSQGILLVLKQIYLFYNLFFVLIPDYSLPFFCLRRWQAQVMLPRRHFPISALCGHSLQRG